MNNRYKSIFGWSTDQEQGELIRRVAPLLPPSINAVEIGAFYGRSTVLICDTLKDERIEYTYTAVDNYTQSKHIDIKDHVKASCKTVGAELLECDLAKSDKFKEDSLDFIYIDCKDVDKFKAIVKEWLPKLKVNGVISGNMQDPVIKTAVVSLFDGYDWVNNQFYFIKPKQKKDKLS